MRTTVPLLLLLAAFGCVAQARTPDVEREARWAREVAPQVVVGDVMWLATPSRAKVLAIYTAAEGTPRGGAIIVHGAGVHPDWGLIGALRTALPARGIATLAVQMPVLAAGAPREQYTQLFQDAAERLEAAMAALRAKGIARMAIVAHSMGASMADAYLAQPHAQRIDAWVAVGMLTDFSSAPREPLLDIAAERDFPEVLVSAKLRRGRLPADRCSRAIVVPGTDHYFDGATQPLAAATTAFLAEVFAGTCAGP